MADPHSPAPQLADIFSDATQVTIGIQEPLSSDDRDWITAAATATNEMAGIDRWDMIDVGAMEVALYEDGLDSGIRATRWKIEGLAKPMYRISQGEAGINVPSLAGLCARLMSVIEIRGAMSLGSDVTRKLH